MIAILIVAIMLGAATGISIQAQLDINRSSTDDNENGSSSVAERINEISRSGMLNEGEQIDLNFDLEMYTYNMSIELSWMDEPDISFRYNHPDIFTLGAFYGIDSDSATQENTHAQMCPILSLQHIKFLKN